jgi:Ser-tRNA(Ala) deacylase AlaX
MGIIWQPGMTLEQAEKEIIMEALKFYETKRATAEALDMGERTLDYKMAKYRKQEEDKVEREKNKEVERAANLKDAQGPMKTIEQERAEQQAADEAAANADGAPAAAVAGPTDESGAPVHVPSEG